MFIDWAAQLNLLVHDPESHILRDFSLPVQKVLVQQVVTFLLDGGNALKTLKSPSHVSWSMETCGQGFLLPIEEEDSISKVINLYKLWSLEVKARPPAINDNPQFFLQKILQHYSLIFETRTSNKDLLEKHANLCSTVIDIYGNIGRNIGPSLSEETWEIFLKLLIGITDYILRPDAPANQEALQKKLCPQLLKILFELWLLSRTRNPSLWEALKQRVRNWTHHISLIKTWKPTCLALTKRSIAILYGPAEGTESVIIKFDESSVQNLNLEEQYVFYSWHRMLYLIGNPNQTIQQAPILLEFMGGVELLVNQYTSIGTSNNKSVEQSSRYLPPNGNTILHIFGTWLYDCIHLDRSGFEEGTALAVKILSHIMITKEKTNFLPIYISSFYSCLQNALNKEGRVLVATLTSSTSIFSKTILGVRCLVPYYIMAIHKVLSGRVSSENIMPPELFRKSCVQILSTIICLSNHFGDTKFTLPSPPGMDIHTYAGLKSHFSSLLTEALSKETANSNIEYLLHLSFTWVCEDIDNNCDFVRQLIGLIVRKVSQKKWTPDVVLAGFKTMSSLAQMYPKIEKGYEQANLVVDQLCRYILNIGNPCPSQYEPIIVLAYQCISNWVLIDQWLFNFKETRQILLSSIVSCLTGKQSDKKSISAVDIATKDDPSNKKKGKKVKEEKTTILPRNDKQPIELSEKIKDAAHTTLLMILNHIGNFPTASGASVVSSLALEQEILQEIIQESNGEVTQENAKEYLRYFITDERVIICVIDRRYHKLGPCCSIIVRDKTGRYVWDSHLSYTPTTIPNDRVLINEPPLPITTNPYHPTTTKPMEVNQIYDVINYLNTCNTKSAFKSIENQVQQEYKVLKRNDFRLNANISTNIPAPADPYIGECKIQHSRMLLSHIGYLSLENRDKLFPINMNQSFFQALRQLDQSNERVCITVGVVYARKAQSEEEWYLNEGGSLDYQEFLATLGWGVNLQSHKGFNGILDSKKMPTAPYWANHNTEIMFQPTTLSSNDHSDVPYKQKLAFENSTLVIWVEDPSNFHPAAIFKRSKTNLLLIVIVPLEYGLYSVHIYTKNDQSTNSIGPLTDGQIVSKDILGTLVRETVIIYNSKENSDKQSPLQIRQDSLDKIYATFKRTCSLEQFYVTQFTSLPPDQVGPPPLESIASSLRSTQSPTVRISVSGTVGPNTSPKSDSPVGKRPSPPNPSPGAPPRRPAPPDRSTTSFPQQPPVRPHPPSERVNVPSIHPPASPSQHDDQQPRQSPVSPHSGTPSPVSPKRPPERPIRKRPPPPGPNGNGNGNGIGTGTGNGEQHPSSSTPPVAGMSPSNRPPPSTRQQSGWLGSARGPMTRSTGSVGSVNRAPLGQQRQGGNGNDDEQRQ